LPKRRYGVTAGSDMSNNEWCGIQLQLLGLNRNHGVVIVAISSDGRV